MTEGVIVKNLFILGTVGVMVAAAAPAGAALPCSIHPAKGASDSQLAGLAKLSRPEAERIALSRVKSPATASVASAELEAEHGCLLWSFDLKVAGEPGVQEVQVDAGDGKVLSVKHETPRHEAAEAGREKAGTAK
jgi:hypothetical protein